MAFRSIQGVQTVSATPSGTITIPTVVNLHDNDTVVLTGLPTDGTKTFVRKTVITDPLTQWTVLADLTALINGLTDLNATDNGVSVITLTVATSGAGMNSVVITGSGTTPLGNLNVTFSGGVTVVLASGAVGTSGHAIRIKNINCISFATGTKTVQVLNGTDSTGTEYDLLTGTASKATQHNFKTGLVLPAGCYIVSGTGISSVTAEFSDLS